MTEFLLMGIRFALFADLMLIVGLAAFLLYAFGPDERQDRELASIFMRPQAWLCAAGLSFSFAGMVVLTASMQGVGIFAVDPAMFVAMVRDTDVGAAWLCRMAALALAFLAATWLGKNLFLNAAAVAILGAVTLGSLVWSGHAAATEGMTGTVHRVNDAVHMIAVAVWFGAIAAFLLLLRPRGAPGGLGFAARSLDQFARIGTICVIIIAVTGLVSGQMIVGVENIGRSVASPYGQLLLAKLVLFAFMLVLAAANRWHLTPAFNLSLAEGNSDAAIRAMRRSLVLEILAGAAILALVAWLGMLEPFLTSSGS